MKSPEIHQLFSHNQLRSLNLAFIDDMCDESFIMLPSMEDNNNRTILNSNCSNSYSPLQKLNLGITLFWLQLKKYVICFNIGKCKITDVSILRMSNLARKLVEIRLQWCSGITDAGFIIIPLTNP